MTQYVRGLTPSMREFWIEMIGSEIIPVKDGEPRLGFWDRVLGRREKAYYVLDIDALDYSARMRLVKYLSNSYNVQESTAEKWVKDYRIRAKTVAKVEGSMDERCPVCGDPLPEKNIRFCPKCGARLSKKDETVGEKPRVIEEPVVENVNGMANEVEEGGLVQAQRVENSITVTAEDLAIKANDFKITWIKVLSFLELMHKSFDLYSITFDENGKAKPRFKTKRK